MDLKHINNRHIWQLGGLAAAGSLWFGSTNAQSVPSYMIMIGFGLMAAMLYYFVFGLIRLAGLYGLKTKRPHRFSLYVTAALSLLVALQSVGELGSRDILVMLPLALLGYIYTSYARTTQRDISA